MCTALTLNKKGSYLFGRNMDIEVSFGQKIVITPRKHVWPMRFQEPMEQKYAIIGMAYPHKDVENGNVDYPLYAEAANEKGLAIAGLNFPTNAFYPKPGTSAKDAYEITPYEFIPWILANFTKVKEVKEQFKKVNIVLVDKTVHPQFQVAPLHFIISDKDESMVVEPCADGIKIYDNPFGVLTNNPTFDWHLKNVSFYQNLVAKQNYDVNWSGFNIKPFGQGFGSFGLPGDYTPPSRFVKTAFLKANSNCGDNPEDLVAQFFHILDAVAMVKGSIVTPEGHDDITLYSSCIDLEKSLYYYKSYANNQINVIDLHAEKIDGKDVVIYPFNDKQAFNFINKK